jgi:hypothetical protein
VNSLAEQCKRTNEVHTFDKLQASQHQLEGSIANFFLGNWPAAITLAGAAEEILPPNEANADIITIAKGRALTNYNRSERDIVGLLNEQKNWLKHHNTSHSETQDFAQENALCMILRALSRLQAHLAPFEPNEHISENIMAFECWFRTHYQDWLSGASTGLE